jgi:hypothetical protein
VDLLGFDGGGDPTGEDPGRQQRNRQQDSRHEDARHVMIIAGRDLELEPPSCEAIGCMSKSIVNLMIMAPDAKRFAGLLDSFRS